MKAARFSILVVLSAILIATTNTFAQDYTTLRLPEGAKARLGKGKINEVKYSPSGATEPERRKEDIITDGIVNIQDLVWVASNFGQSGSKRCGCQPRWDRQYTRPCPRCGYLRLRKRKKNDIPPNPRMSLTYVTSAEC